MYDCCSLWSKWKQTALNFWLDSRRCVCCVGDRTLKILIGPVSGQQHRSQRGPFTANPSEWLWARGKPCECRSNGFYCPTLSGCCSVGSGSVPGCLRLWLPCRLCTRPPHCWSPTESNQGGVNLLPLASRRWRFCLTSSGSWSVCTPAPVQTRRFSPAICLCAAKADVKASRKVLSGQQKAGRVCC